MLSPLGFVASAVWYDFFITISSNIEAILRRDKVAAFARIRSGATLCWVKAQRSSCVLISATVSAR